MKPAQVAIITPYYKEDAATLERCRASVRAQSHQNVIGQVSALVEQFLDIDVTKFQR